MTRIFLALISFVCLLASSGELYAITKQYRKKLSCRYAAADPKELAKELIDLGDQGWSQNRGNPKVLVAKAAESFPEFKSKLDKAVYFFKAERPSLYGPNTKSIDSSLSKTSRKGVKGKKPRQIFDYLRATIIVDQVETLYSMLGYFATEYHIAKVKDYIHDPKGNGYRAVHFSLKLDSGHIAEVQLHLRPLWEIKSKADEIYRQVRELELQSKLLEENVNDLA